MSDAPDRVWLQVDESPEVTWCSDKIYDTDVEYVKATRPRPILGDAFWKTFAITFVVVSILLHLFG